MLVFVIAAGVRAGSNQGGEDMIKNVYIYLVLFATLMMTIGGSVSVFMAAADIVAPAPYYQSFEDFKRWGQDKQPALAEGETKQEETKEASEEELRRDYEAMILAEKERQVNRAKNSLIKSFGWIVIPLPIFVYFQRLRKETN